MMLVAQVKEVLHLCSLSEKVNVFKSLKEKKIHTKIIVKHA